MSLTESTMLPLNTPAPAFTLFEPSTNEWYSLEHLKSDCATVICFICNHCPYVKHIREGLIALATEYQKKGITFIAINANDVNQYPDDSPDDMRRIAKEFKYPFHYLYDETQEVAKAYHAACTPDFFVFDKVLKCVYRGRMDDSRPGSDVAVTGKDLRHALDNVLSGKPVDSQQQPSMGCNIKWKV